MARLYTILLFALLVLVMPVESAALSGNLTGLRKVSIVVKDLDRVEKELGLNEDELKAHVLVLLWSKLPRLAVSESGTPVVHVAPLIEFIKTEGGKKTGYYGFVLIRIVRRIIIVETSKDTEASVWGEAFSVIGPLDFGNAVNNVRGVLDRLLTEFAADWYRDNP